MLTFCHSILSSDSEGNVLRALLGNIGDLEIIRLLHSEDVRSIGLEHRGSRYLTDIPRVVSVISDTKADVIGHDIERDLCLFLA